MREKIRIVKGDLSVEKAVHAEWARGEGTRNLRTNNVTLHQTVTTRGVARVMLEHQPLVLSPTEASCRLKLPYGVK